MMVWSEEPDHRPGEYDPDPEVLEQLTEFEAGGRFLAEWDGNRWRIGKRVVDNAKNIPSFTLSTDGLFGFLILSQLFERPARYAISRLLDTTPSSPSLYAALHI